MNILTCSFKGFLNVSYRAFPHMHACASPLAAMRSFLTRNTEVVTSRKVIGVTFDTFAGPVRQPYPLSKEEAFSFVENVLGLEHPDTLFKTDPLKNLTKIAEGIKKVSPYTTMSFWDGSLYQLNDYYFKHRMIHGHGGGCVVINPFTKAILDHLGYTTYDVSARVVASSDAFHLSTIVCDLSYPGSIHLVEPGTIRPLFHPIALDFEQESSVYEVYGLRNKFFKRNDGNVVWCMEPLPKMLNRLGNHEVIQDSAGTKWQIFLIYMLQRKMGRCHFNEYWHKVIRGKRYIPPRTNGFVYVAYKNGDLIHVFAGKQKIFVQTLHKDATEEAQELTKEELLRLFEKNFPGFPTRMVGRAIQDNFQISQLLRNQ
ncbi:hypothetical protein HOLleu_19977 [Holothuria leucospilota]|uniref:Arylamine N-acetyltransferase n=1 Tax=Holothuria leucospilota TaxID=206669 RepID=A0A9Q1H8C2_HOLLE|nr:hypothetical protein HOLleu_19977 [Holothuria leucospilota]